MHTSNLVITACGHCGDVSGVLRVLDDMKGRDVSANDFTLIMVLQAYMFKRRGQHEVSFRRSWVLQAYVMRGWHEASLRRSWQCDMLPSLPFHSSTHCF